MLEMLAQTMFCEELNINWREELKCHLEQINSSAGTFERGIKAAASQQQSASSSEMGSIYSCGQQDEMHLHSGGGVGGGRFSGFNEGCKRRA